MSHTNNLIEFLSTNSYNLEEITHFLECDNSSINKKNSFGSTPLSEVLMDSKCSIDIVRLLLRHGADVNPRDVDEFCLPLFTALCYSRDEAIIAALLEKGANIDDCGLWRRNPLRYIFGMGITGKPEWYENVLNLLLEKGLDLNKVYDDGNSLLCLALSKGADVRDIELLLSKGGSLYACQKHASPLHCLTDDGAEALLKASVVQLLLDKHQAREGEVFEMDLEPLQNALRYRRYETAAIKLLLEHSDENAVNTWIQQTNYVLHLVVQNDFCNPNIVKLFFKRGACIDKLNAHGETVLHSAMTSFTKYCVRDPSLVAFLLRSGAPVNVKSKYRGTALKKAISQGRGNCFINLLLAFGAKFSVSCDQDGISLLERALVRYKDYQGGNRVFNTLLKYYFLEFPGFHIQELIEDHRDYESLPVFAAKCTDELQKMESKNVRSDCTLRRFISENFLLDVKTDHETKVVLDDCQQLLQILYSNEFPEYFDVIASKILASKVGEVFLKNNLQELEVYTVNRCPVNPSLIKKVVLNYVCVRELAIYLSDEELLRLIVAFYHADGPTYSNNDILKKRNLDSEQFTKFGKRTKM